MAKASPCCTQDLFDTSASETDAEHNAHQSRIEATTNAAAVVLASPSSQKPFLNSIEPEERYFSDTQVAERNGVARPTIWRWVKTNPGFPSPVEISPGTTRWRLTDLRAFEATRKSKRSAAK